jgi:tetratricopeptide (TPR) repeat protein
VLYELLTGKKAHRLADGGAAELERAVCQTEPPKPSEAAPGLGRLRGDLDNIVLKALEKQPDRRYLHVEQLSEDIERHLDGRPVIARPDTITYRMTKFCRRHKFFAASAAAILVTLTGGIIAVSWQARIARRERAVAERRFDETRKLAWTLLFEIDPDIANLAGATKVREKLLTRGIAFLDALSRDAKGDPGLLRELAEAYQNIAEVRGAEGVSNLGKQGMATENLRKAVALREQVLLTHPKSIELRLELCVTLRRLASLIGDNAESDRLTRRSLEIAEAAVQDAPGNPRARVALASAHYQMGERLRGSDRRQAISQFRKALELYQGPANISLMHKKIAAMLLLENDPEHSIDELTAAISIDEEEVQRNPQDARRKMDLSFGYSDLGNSLQLLHRFPEAIEKFRMAEAIRHEQAAADPGDLRARGSIVSITWRIGRVLALSGDKRGALETMQKAVNLSDALISDFPGNANAHAQAVDAYIGFAAGQIILGNCHDAIRWWNLARSRAAEWKVVLTDNEFQCPGSPNRDY